MSLKPLFAASILAAISAVSVSAWSQQATSDQLVAARRGLLSDAQAASARGDHAQALDLSERAGRIEMTPSLRIFIAREQQALGQLAEALGSADDCVREAEAAGGIHNRDIIESQCRTLVNDLQGRLGRVLVRLPTPIPHDVVVRIGNATLPEVLYGAPFRVTPGHIHVEVSAPGATAFHREIDVAAGASVEVAVTLEPATNNAPHASEASTAQTSSRSPAPATTQAAASTSASTHASGKSMAPIGVIVAGLVIAIGGAALTTYGNLTVASINQNSCNQAPNGGGFDCLPSAMGPYNTAVLLDYVGIGAMIGGGVVAALGVILFATARPHEESHQAGRHSLQFGLIPSHEGGFATLRGSF